MGLEMNGRNEVLTEEEWYVATDCDVKPVDIVTHEALCHLRHIALAMGRIGLCG